MRETTRSSNKLAEPSTNGHTGRSDAGTCDRYDTWYDLCEVKEARLRLSETRKRRSPPSVKSDCADSASDEYESLLSIEVEIKRRKVSEQNEAAALSFLLAPDTTFPVKRQRPLGAPTVADRENALDMLTAMNLITVDSVSGDVLSVSDSARAMARQLGCVQSMVVKATELSSDPDAEELANFPSVMEIEKKKVRIAVDHHLLL